VFVDRSEDEFVVTLNSMARQTAIDAPREVAVTIDASYLSLNANFAVQDSSGAVSIDSQSGSSVTFTVTPGQNSEAYTITGLSVADNPPIVSQESPGPFFLSDASSPVSFRCFARDEGLVTGVSVLVNDGSGAVVLDSAAPNAESYAFETSSSFAVGSYSWACRAEDDSAQVTTTAYRLFSVGEEEEPVPDPDPEPDEEPSTPSGGGGGGGGGSLAGSATATAPVEELERKQLRAEFATKEVPVERTAEDAEEPLPEPPLIESPSLIVEAPRSSRLFLRVPLVAMLALMVFVVVLTWPKLRG